MTNILLAIIAVTLGVLTGFAIAALLEIKNAARDIKKFIVNTDNSLGPALEELTRTLKDVKEITNDINAVTADSLLASVGGVAGTIEGVNEFVEDLPFKMTGIKAGIGAAASFIIARLFRKSNKC